MSTAFDGAVLLLHSFALGALLGLLYDLFRIRRIAAAPTGSFGARRAPRPLTEWDGKAQERRSAGTLLLFIEDLCFALFAAVCFLLLFYSLNGGVVRWFAFVAAGTSFSLYRLTVGRLLMRLSDRIICGIRFVLKWMWSRVLRPLLTFLFAPVRFCVGRLTLAVQRGMGRWRERKLLRMAVQGKLPLARKQKKEKKKKGA